jgi:hypothetical protein
VGQEEDDLDHEEIQISILSLFVLVVQDDHSMIVLDFLRQEDIVVVDSQFHEISLFELGLEEASRVLD